MTFFEDLTLYRYVEPEPSKNVGWLDGKHAFTTGDMDPVLIGRLTKLTRYSVRSARGVFFCEICISPSTVSHLIGDELCALGTAEIRVFGNDGSSYAAPNLLVHYILEHNYKPPDEFLTALAEGPFPPDKEYFDKLDELGLKWYPPPLYQKPRRITDL